MIAVETEFSIEVGQHEINLSCKAEVEYQYGQYWCENLDVEYRGKDFLPFLSPDDLRNIKCALFEAGEEHDNVMRNKRTML